MKALAAEFRGRARVVKLDTDTLMFSRKRIKHRYKISELPSVIFFKDGEEVARLVGADQTGKARVRDALLAALGGALPES